MIKLIATDLDGTLLYPKRPFKLVSTRNKRMFKKFYENGGQVTLVTARGPKFSKLVANRLGIPCNIIACCGAYIEANNKVVQNITINNNIIKEIVEEVNKNRKRVGYVISTDDFQTLCKYYGTKKLDRFLIKAYRLKNGRYNEDTKVNEEKFDNFLNSDRGVFKMYIFLSDFIKGKRYEMAEILKEKFSDKVDIIVSRSGVEISIKDINKGNSIEKLLSNTQFQKSEVAVVGDDANDIPMFEIYENSFVLEHGYSKAIDFAKYKVKNFKEVFKIIEEIK